MVNTEVHDVVFHLLWKKIMDGAGFGVVFATSQVLHTKLTDVCALLTPHQGLSF